MQSGSTGGFAEFWHQWTALDGWPSGPPWFLWVLLAFDVLAALLYAVVPQLGRVAGKAARALFRHPVVFFVVLIGLSIAAYVPLSMKVSPFEWASYGPFVVQTGRILNYALYFFAGAALGALGREAKLLSASGRLATWWPAWIAVAAGAFAGQTWVIDRAIATNGDGMWVTLASVAFCVSCAASSFACLAAFARFAARRGAALDSLRANTYGMYLVHYAAVSWLQYSLLGAALPGAAKFGLVTGVAIAASWAITSTLRRIPWVARVV